MEKRTYKVTFVTPAFLGDAHQQGRWRTPPFKALLRQWWRVVKAPDVGYDHRKLRELEGRLFGHAWLTERNERGRETSWAMRSHVRLRLAEWREGRLTSEQWPGGRIQSVQTTRHGGRGVRSDVYLGYGPVVPPSRRQGRDRPALLHPPAIAPGTRDEDSVVLTIAFPSSREGTEAQDVEKAIDAIHWFGNLGSRANNGWGAVELRGDGTTPDPEPLAVDRVRFMCRPLRQCLVNDWPHAIGADERGPLIWTAKRSRARWQEVIEDLARLKVEVRRKGKELRGPRSIAGIHLLGYPAGGIWQVRAFGNDARWASQLRFTVHRDREGLRAVVYHLPHCMPRRLASELPADQRAWLDKNQLQVWKAVHGVLDQELTRLGGPSR